jgi:hypothetical protein
MSEPVPSLAPRSLPVQMLVGFGRFWWEFLIGDTPELFVGAVTVLGVVALVCLGHPARTWAAVLMPVLVAGLLGGSVWKAKRKHVGASRGS